MCQTLESNKRHSFKVIGECTVLVFIFLHVCSKVYLNVSCIVVFFANFVLTLICVCVYRRYCLLLSLKAVLKSPIPSRLIAPAPVSNQGHISIPSKVPGHITVTIETSTTTPSIPVATISGQQVRKRTAAHLT